MTPSEKAQELIDKFKAEIVKENNHVSDGFVNTVSKQCALIACEEVIQQDKVWSASIGLKGGQFWLDVKKEIEKM